MKVEKILNQKEMIEAIREMVETTFLIGERHIENLQLMELCQWDGKIQTSWCRETDANSWADEILPLRCKNL